jgi:uncharacterized protein (DUF433 family)
MMMRYRIVRRRERPATMEPYGVQANYDQPSPDGGVPCIRGLRIPVATVVTLVAEEQTPEQILALYRDLEAEDIRDALQYAAEAARERALAGDDGLPWSRFPPSVRRWREPSWGSCVGAARR